MYYPNTAAWIVSQVACESIYTDIRPDDNNTSTLQSRTRYRYDNQACWNLAPGAQGRLTAVDRWFGPRGGTAADCYRPDYDITTYAYDAGVYGIGRRTGMSDASGSMSWTYDVRGRVIQETKTSAGSPSPPATPTTRWTAW